MELLAEKRLTHPWLSAHRCGKGGCWRALWGWGKSLLSIVFICHTVSLVAQALGTDSSYPNSHVLSGVMGLEPGTEVLLGRERGGLPPAGWVTPPGCPLGAE